MPEEYLVIQLGVEYSSDVTRASGEPLSVTLPVIGAYDTKQEAENFINNQNSPESYAVVPV